MDLLTQILVWLGIGLLGTILARGAAARLFRVFPVLFSYIAYLTAISIGGYFVLISDRILYTRFYWVVHLTGVLLGFGVTWELVTVAMRRFPGGRRVAHSVMAGSLGVLSSLGIVSYLNTTSGSELVTTLDVARYFRAVQVILMVAFLGVARLYSIPVQPPARQITLGFGLYLSCSLVFACLRTYLGARVQPYWATAQQVASLAALGIWCLAFRKRVESAVEDAEGIEQGYETLYNQTLATFSRAKQSVSRVAK